MCSELNTKITKKKVTTTFEIMYGKLSKGTIDFGTECVQ